MSDPKTVFTAAGREPARLSRGFQSAALASVLASVLAAALAGCGRKPALYSYVIRGSSATSEKLGVTGGNLVAVSGKPGVFFGTVKTPKRPTAFNYFIVFHHGPSATVETGHSTEDSASNDGTKAAARNAVAINGKWIEAEFQLEVDPATGETRSEVLTIGGKAVDPAAGRVFLIDLNSPAPAYEQKNYELPGDLPVLEEPAQIERFSGEVLEKLRSRYPDLATFLAGGQGSK